MSKTKSAKPSDGPKGKAMLLPAEDELDILLNQLINCQRAGVKVATGNVNGDFVIRLYAVHSETTGQGLRLVHSPQTEAPAPLQTATA